MILLYGCISHYFTIGLRYESFYNRNALDRFFNNKNVKESVLQEECIWKDFVKGLH